MRKFLLILGATATAAILPATPALAEGSIVINDGSCTGFVPTPTGGIGAFLFDGRVHSVTKGSTTTLTCHLDIPEGLEPKKPTKATGQVCTTVLGETTDTRMQASPGGRAVGTCRIRN